MKNPHEVRWGHRARSNNMGRLIVGGVLLAFTSFSAVSEAKFAKKPGDALVRAQLKYQGGRGLGPYIALRQMWALWGQMDPLRVEQALILAANDHRKSAPIRNYARMLSAYGRLRRGDLKSAQQNFTDQGYLNNFLIVGPFDNEGKMGFQQVFGPHASPSEPLVPGRAFSGKERPVRYRELPHVFKYGWIDFGYLVRPSTHICAYATTFLSASVEKSQAKKSWKKSKSKKITLWAGTDGAYQLTFNGKTVLEDSSYRGFDTDRQGATVSLLPGQNRLSIKVCGADSTPMFSLRVADQNGNPDPTLVVTTRMQASEEARENVIAAQEQPLLPHPSRLGGPLSLVEKIAANKNASANDLEKAARYLVLTNGDDSITHEARDLARRAVEKKPNVERHLLLASLAEDRNAAGESIDAAAALAQDTRIDVLLAQARHRSTGPSPHASFTLFDQVLALDPDNLTALRGRVELYNTAGLKRTALATLEKALVRRPHSVLLINMVASQRSTLGLSDLARQAEDKYSSLRFDDSSYLSSRMELALTRRNKPDALHFLSRLQETDPQSLWVYKIASRVHRALGDKDRALLDLEFARSIAPEDVGILQSLADLRGRKGDTDEQLLLLQEVLRLRPQQVDVRKYVGHIEPPEAPADEKYAMASAEFLKKRHAPAEGYPKRTLQDLSVTTVYENGLSSQFRQVVFQPLTDSSAATARQYAFQYQADSQRVQLKGARVYRADGNIDEAIESGEGAANDPSISMYTSARTFYIQFPRLEPGDVVELRYRIDDITPRNEFADYFGDVVMMQSDEPLAHAEYVLITPKSRKLLIDAHVPHLKETVSETKTSKIYHFEADNVPAIVPEAGMPPWSEVLGFVHVSTYSNWNELGKWYWGLVKEQLDLDEETRLQVHQIVGNAKTDEEKVKAVYAWVTKNTRYVALEFGIYGFKPRRCVQTVNRGWGDCKDKATVIVTFLRELGIDANLVILRTGMRGNFRSDLASLAPFDHAIAYVPSMDLYLDGTAENTGIYELPVMDHGALALLVLDGKAKLVRLPAPDPEKNIVSRTLHLNLNASGKARLRLNTEIKGYAAPRFRSRYGAESSRRDRINSYLGREFPGIEIDKNGLTMNDLGDAEVPATMKLQASLPRFARKEGDTLSMPVTLKTRLTPRYALLSSRKQDVRISGFSSRKETVHLKLPHKAKVIAAPPQSSYESRFGSYKVVFKQKGRDLTITSELSLKVDRVSPKEYGAFRAFCVAADQALSHRLLVKP